MIASDARRMFKYINDLYVKIRDLPEQEFYIIADESPWAKCLYKMKDEDKTLIEVIQESTSVEILCAIKKFIKMEK